MSKPVNRGSKKTEQSPTKNKTEVSKKNEGPDTKMPYLLLVGAFTNAWIVI